MDWCWKRRSVLAAEINAFVCVCGGGGVKASDHLRIKRERGVEVSKLFDLRDERIK